MPGVKMFGCIPRRPDISRQFFHDHWRHPHGSLGRHISTMRRYVQSHQFDSDLLGPTQTHFEGCAEVWFDSVEDGLSFDTEPVYVRDVKPDEPLFVDLPNLRFAFADEEVLVSGPDLREPISDGDAAWRLDNRPTSVKLLQFIISDGGVPWASPDDRALGHRIGALRHVRSRPSPVVHADGAFVIGIRELWWPTLWDLEQGVAKDRAAWDALAGRPGESIAMIANAERFI